MQKCSTSSIRTLWAAYPRGGDNAFTDREVHVLTIWANDPMGNSNALSEEVIIDQMPGWLENIMCHFHIYDKTNYLRLVAVLKKMGRCYRGKNMAGTEGQKYGQTKYPRHAFNLP